MPAHGMRSRAGPAPPGMAEKLVRIASALLVAGGLGALLLINGLDLYAQWQAEAHISRFSAVFDDADDPRRLEYLRQARLHNARLAGQDVPEDVLPYAEQLFYQHEPMMSYLEIPRISVRLPIYHGTAEAELMAGVGHLEESSLPVGGAGTHCVLLGHSGMRNTRMFDDLHRLEPGDLFVVWTLNEPYAYRVERMDTVLPGEVPERIGIQAGRDLATLITCTPYGVNSHRLLVRGQRCAYDRQEAGDVGIDAYVNDRNLPLLAALGALTACAAAALRRAHAGRRSAAKTSRPR